MVSLNILRTKQNRGRAKARGGWGHYSCHGAKHVPPLKYCLAILEAVPFHFVIKQFSP